MDYSQLSVSDGTGEAVIANIENDRAIASVTIDVDSVDNFPQKFIAASGTKLVTNYIDPATMTVFYGHLDGGNIVIDGFAPGYADAGNTEGQIVVIKPNTFWADELVELAKIAHEDDGKLKADAPIEGNQPTLDLITPVGSVVDFAGTSAPTGWLLCYGQALDASADTEYQALFDVIGNTFGGSDNTNFVVPDLRGRVVAGQDDMGGSSANRLTGASGGVNGDTFGAAGGAETHTLTTAQLAAHVHGQVTTLSSGGGLTVRVDDDGITGAGATQIQGADTLSAGSGSAHNNVQPTIILNKIIKF